MSGEWIICQACGAGQNARAEATCTRCGADTSQALASANRPYTPLSALKSSAGEGSLFVGLMLGLVAGLFGLIGAVALGRGETKKGAAIGYGIRLVLTIIIVGLRS